MASKEMHYVEAHKGNTTIKLPMFGLDKPVNREANAVIKNLINHGWFGPETEGQSPQHTTESVDARHPHWRPFLENA